MSKNIKLPKRLKILLIIFVVIAVLSVGLSYYFYKIGYFSSEAASGSGLSYCPSYGVYEGYVKNQNGFGMKGVKLTAKTSDCKSGDSNINQPITFTTTTGDQGKYKLSLNVNGAAAYTVTGFKETGGFCSFVVDPTTITITNGGYGTKDFTGRASGGRNCM